MNETPEPGVPVSDLSTSSYGTVLELYEKGRPRYPVNLLSSLRHDINLEEKWVIADIGSGSGFLSDLFLRNGNIVFGVEPDAAMRKQAEHRFTGQKSFVSVNGCAERTALSETSIDCIVVGQAFHWFDPLASKNEWCRVLRHPGWVVLIWNLLDDENQINDAYRSIVKSYCPRFAQTEAVESMLPLSIQALFRPHGFSTGELKFTQRLSREELTARFLSNSYSPSAEQFAAGGARTALDRLFQHYCNFGFLELTYKCVYSYGTLLMGSNQT